MIDSDYTIATLSDLVRINSINPAFTSGATNETEIARYVHEAMARMGLEVTAHEPEPGRTSIVGRIRGATEGPVVILYAHVDTVGVEEMAAPFAGDMFDGRLHGRGAYDMKGGLAACLGAAKAIVASGLSRGEILITAVADEEVASIGMAEVLRHHAADAAIVTEPTELQVCVAHKGFCWIEVQTHGRAAHGSQFRVGVDANMRMGRFLAQLEGLERRLRASPGHPLVGPPSLHAPVIRGGTGPSTYSAHCRLEIERRTIPGESTSSVLSEIEDIVRRLMDEDPTFDARARMLLARDSFEVAPDARIVRTVSEVAARVLGKTAPLVGMPYWMDAALLAAAGIETVVIGPMGQGAHAKEEWVEVASVVKLAEILARAATTYCEAN